MWPVIGPSGVNRNVKAKVLPHVRDVFSREVDRRLHRHGDGISGEHEALDLVMSALVVGDGLQRKVCDARRKVLLLHDLDTGEVKRIGGL